jgi:hypothetical protein
MSQTSTHKLNIDSPAFDSKAYFKNFIKDKNIEEVIQKNNELFSGTDLFIHFCYLNIKPILFRNKNFG